MTKPLETCCPHCQTTFRVTEAQLGLREGRVRCGRCRQVFDGRLALVAGTLADREPAVPPLAEASLVERGTATERETATDRGAGGAPAVTPEHGGAVDRAVAPDHGVAVDGRPVAADSDRDAADTATPEREPGAFVERLAAVAEARFGGGGEARLGGETPAGVAGVDEAVPAGPPDVVGADATPALAAAPRATEPAVGRAGQEGTAAAPPEPQFVLGTEDGVPWARVGTPEPSPRRWLWTALVPLLALALAAQAAYALRHELAARVPALAAPLANACLWLGCRIEPPRARDRLSIEASDLHADPGHRGLLTLSATLRNRNDLAVAYPNLELTLTDLHDQPVARRVLGPAEYAGGTARIEQGIPANGEVSVKLFIDASNTRQQGYRLHVFYP